METYDLYHIYKNLTRMKQVLILDVLIFVWLGAIRDLGGY